jgi:hypothetical protein
MAHAGDQPVDELAWEDWLLLIPLAGLALVNLLGVGSYQSFVYLTAGLVLVKAVKLVRRDRAAAGTLGLITLAPLTFVLCDLLAADGHSNKNATRNLLAFVAIASAVWMLPRFGGKPASKHLHLGLLVALALISVTHSLAIAYAGQPFGLFENPHFVALGAVVTALILAHGWRHGGTFRVVAMVGIGSAIFNLHSVSSNVGWLALLMGAAAAGVTHLPRQFRSLALAAGGLLIATTLLYPLFHDVYLQPIGRAAALLIPDQDLDERFFLWKYSWQLQQDAGGFQWVFGHGLGGFGAMFAGYSEFPLVFPHHFFLEVLYNSGLVGLIAFLLPLGMLLAAVVRRLHQGQVGFGLAAAMLTAVGCFTFLALPIAARPTAHYLGFAVGFALWTLHARALPHSRSAGNR